MKKLLLALIVFAALAVPAGIYWRRTRAPHVARGAELAPADAILFAQIPSIPRTAERWKLTSLAQLLREPEMKAFLEKPMAKMAGDSPWMAQFETLHNLSPGEAFLTVTSIDGPEPRFVAGFSFGGSRREVERLLEQPWAALKSARPAGRAELVNYGAAEIESFTDKDAVAAGVFRDDWYFFGNDLALLEQTLDRYDGKNGASAGGLATAPGFVEATAPLPADRDALIVAQLGQVMERVTALMLASGQSLDGKQLADLKKTKAIAASTKLDGADFRDTIFILSTDNKAEPPLARHALSLTSSATLLLFATALPATIELPDSATAALTLVLPNIAPMQKSLAAHGLSFSDWNQAFGPEFGAAMDWPQGLMQPSFVLTLDVRDAVKARAFTDVLTGPLPGSPAWTKTETDGAITYSAPAEGLGLISPTFALTDRFLIAGFSADSVALAETKLKSGEANLGSSAPFLTAEKTVAPATSSFAYLDLRGLFERAYGTFRPFIIMSLAFAPVAGEWIDGGKLPSTETFTKHLGPIVMSQSTTATGTLLESTGTLTINQVLVAAVGGAIRAALPNLQNIEAAALDPAKLLNLTPPQTAPIPPPPAQPAPPAAPEPTPEN